MIPIKKYDPYEKLSQRITKYRAWSPKFGGMIYPDSKFDIKIDSTGHGTHTVWEGGRDDEGVPVMQFTGHLDIHRVEIYEADIMKNKFNEIFIVEISAGTAQMRQLGPRRERTTKTRCYNIGGERIGNIFENPDLIDAFLK